MKFWDSSAIIPLLVPEPETKALASILRSDGDVLTWWGTRLECAGALARLERDRRITTTGAAQARARLELLTDQWIEVAPTGPVREQAERLVRVHALRAADAQPACRRDGGERAPTRHAGGRHHRSATG